MTREHPSHAAPVTAISLLILASCSATEGLPSSPRPSSNPSARPSASEHAEDPCQGQLADAEPVTFAVGEHDVEALLIGSGDTAVVFSNESDRDLCGWLPFARDVAKAGYTALLYEYGRASKEDQQTAAVEVLRQRGAAAVILVGASVGANYSLRAALSIDPPIAGVVSLSAEQEYRLDELAVPVLFVSTQAEIYVAPERTREFYERAAATDKAVEILPGNEHGSDILLGPSGPEARQLLMDFLTSHADG